jgi:hypothetical protein
VHSDFPGSVDDLEYASADRCGDASRGAPQGAGVIDGKGTAEKGQTVGIDARALGTNAAARGRRSPLSDITGTTGCRRGFRVGSGRR